MLSFSDSSVTPYIGAQIYFSGGLLAVVRVEMGKLVSLEENPQPPGGQSVVTAADSGGSSLGAIPKVPSSVVALPVPEGASALAHPKTNETPACRTDSQAPEDQVAIVNEMCRHVEQVMEAFGAQDTSCMPTEASRALEKLKGKMVLFASGDSTSALAGDNGRVDSGSGSEFSCSGADSDSSAVSHAGVKRTPTTESKFSPAVGQKPSFDGLRSLRMTNASLEERLVVALEKLDLRTVPAPEPFDRSSGESFSAFLLLFEDYCRHSFRGSQTLWVAELGRHLVGEMHRAFLAHKASGDSYDEVKNKLLSWYKESKKRREAGSRAAFCRASIGMEESVRLYAARLENLYRRAFPQGRVESSRTLLDKFLKSVPRKYKKQIKSALSQAQAFNSRSLGWSQVVKLVGGLEEALASEKSSDEEPSSWSVMRSSVRQASVGQREAATQYNPGGEDLQPSNSCPRELSQSAERREPIFQSVGFGERERQLATVCHFCRKLGHFQRDCRRKNGLCLVCGSGDHQVASCPQRQADGRNRNFSPSNRSRSFQELSSVGETPRRVSFNDARTGGEADQLNLRRPVWRESHRN